MKSRPRKSQTPKDIRILQVKIESVAFGGEGIARHDGKVIFVADTLPGEEVKVALVEDKERFARGEVRERLQAPPYAVPSLCPYSARCGGCQWLEAPYDQQLIWKTEFIASALQRIAKLEVPADLRVQASPGAGAYRNRIKIKLLHRSDGSLVPGYFAQGRHDHVAIKACWIAADPLNKALSTIARLNLGPSPMERIYEVELQHLADGLVTATVVSEGAHAFHRQLRAAVSALADPSLHVSAGEEAPRLLEEEKGLRYLTYAGQFQQVNLAGNRLLRNWVRERLLGLGVRRVLDLYCGSGNLSLALVAAGVQVWGLEVSDMAIACAQANLAANQLSAEKGLYVRGTAEQLPALFPSLEVDAVIVDPPRKGMAEALPHLLALAPVHLIYISCDPNTLARDLKILCAAGYQIEACLGFDFFPQTYHVETVVALRLGK